MHDACLVSVMPPWTPHASVSLYPNLFYIFYKCAKLCGFWQEWWSLVAGTSMGQIRSTIVLASLCHSLRRVSRPVLPSYVTQRARERGCITFIVSHHLWFPCLPTPARHKGMRLPSCPRAPAWPGSVLLATCRGMTSRGAGERMCTTFLPGRGWAPTQEERALTLCPTLAGPLSELSLGQDSGGWLGSGKASKGNAGIRVESGAYPTWERK